MALKVTLTWLEVDKSPSCYIGLGCCLYNFSEKCQFFHHSFWEYRDFVLCKNETYETISLNGVIRMIIFFTISLTGVRKNSMDYEIWKYCKNHSAIKCGLISSKFIDSKCCYYAWFILNINWLFVEANKNISVNFFKGWIAIFESIQKRCFYLTQLKVVNDLS